jgi:hypothetical protein
VSDFVYIGGPTSKANCDFQVIAYSSVLNVASRYNFRL